MASKKRSLISEVKGADVSQLRTGPVPVADRFEQDHPEDFALVAEAIEDWLNGGTMKALFHSRAGFQRYLSGKHHAIPCDPPVLPPMAATSFLRIIETIQERTRHGKEAKSRK